MTQIERSARARVCTGCTVEAVVIKADGTRVPYGKVGEYRAPFSLRASIAVERFLERVAALLARVTAFIKRNW